MSFCGYCDEPRGVITAGNLLPSCVMLAVVWLCDTFISG